MAFSFADIGFWRLAAISFGLDVLHLILEKHMPGLKSLPLGPRPVAAEVFMLLEFVFLVAAEGAAIGSLNRLFKSAVRPVKKITALVVASFLLLGAFIFVWQR